MEATTDKQLVWDRFFDAAQRDYEGGRDVGEACTRMCEIMMSRDPKMQELVGAWFAPEDFFFVREHMIGTGLIGGKACGMLTARQILERADPELYERIEPHDSFFIGSDVFDSYLVENDLWDLHIRQRTEAGYFSAAEEFAARLLEGRFPAEIERALREMLVYYGPSPVIVRSSSILEDGFGNAFAGKYESVFCANTGGMRARMHALKDAIRTVYASMMSRSALDYRKRRHLDTRDEQMALLVQRVSGVGYGDYVMPCAAGVGYSHSAYRFLEEIDPEAGMLRLVAGLGTSAVDRAEGAHPRLVNLDRPEATPFTTEAERHRYAQQSVEVIDRTERALSRLPLMRILPTLPAHVRQALLSHDRDAERRFRERGQVREVLYITCDGLVKDQALMRDMRRILQILQETYGHPVDIEYTINLRTDGTYAINLLQCRPLQAFRDAGRVSEMGSYAPEDIALHCRRASMGQSQSVRVDEIVYVDPNAYYRMPYSEKTRIARLVGAVSWQYREREENLILMVPGRIGTSSPELGVPVTFADISSFCAVIEIAESSVGYAPELSYGSHMFQDLVENEILYAAVFEDARTERFDPELFRCAPNRISAVDEGAAAYAGVIGLYDVSGIGCSLYHDLRNEELILTVSGGKGQ